MGLLLDVLSDLVVFATIVMAIISLIQKSGKKNSNKKQPSHKKQKQQESVDYTEKLRTLWHNTEQNVMERRIEEKSINVEKNHNANSQKNRSQNKKKSAKTVPSEPEKLYTTKLSQQLEEDTFEPIRLMSMGEQEEIGSLESIERHKAKTASKRPHRVKRTALQKAIIYSEVLGKPKSMQ